MGVGVPEMNHDPERFKEPFKFNPDRFEGENAAHLKEGMFAFSAGQRSCLGEQLSLVMVKVAVAYILQQYELFIEDTTLEFEIKQQYGPTKTYPINFIVKK